MAKLENSRRELLQAIYTPVKISVNDEPGNQVQIYTRSVPAAIKWGYASSLNPSKSELYALKEEVNKFREPTLGKQLYKILDVFEAVFNREGQIDYHHAVSSIGKLDENHLSIIGEELARIREHNILEVEKTLNDLKEEYLQNFKASNSNDPKLDLSDFQLLGPASNVPSGKLYQRSSSSKLMNEIPGKLEPSETHAQLLDSDNAEITNGQVLRNEIRLVIPQADSEKRSNVDNSPEVDIILEWAKTNNTSDPRITRITEVAQLARLNSMQIKIDEFMAFVKFGIMGRLADNQNIFNNQFDIEPVGLLHLERLTFEPHSIEKGELVYSVPLAPNEEVNITHKEWSNTSEQFERIVTDFIEEYSELGVTEKSEMASSTTSQRQHADGFAVGVNATGGYGPVSLTTSFSASVSNASSTSQQFSRDQSISVTRKASSRVKKEHKTSFKVASAAGTEDQTIRKLKNPFDDKATRIDYYQLIRKWEVNAYRYGLRLTYDITIPEPGSDALDRIIEINELTHALDQGFGAPNNTLWWAKFDLDPTSIDRTNYVNMAAQYNATVPPPPDEYLWFDQPAIHAWGSKDEAKRAQFHVLEIEVPPEYKIVDAGYTFYYTVFSSEPTILWIEPVTDFLGKSGKRVLLYQTKYVASLAIELFVEAQLRDEKFREWQNKAWTAIRDAAQERYAEQRQIVKERLTDLENQLHGDDALSLRKFEREEIMKGVLRWLFGPQFYFLPPGTPDDLYLDSTETVVSISV